MSRYFKVKYGNDKMSGRFIGKKPKQAANKAFSSIIKTMAIEPNTECDFSVVEIGINREYLYTGVKQKLDDPVKINIPGSDKEIVCTYSNKVWKRSNKNNNGKSENRNDDANIIDDLNSSCNESDSDDNIDIMTSYTVTLTI